MPNYNLSDFQSWLNKEENSHWKCFQNHDDWSPPVGTPIQWEQIITDLAGQDLTEYLKNRHLYLEVYQALSLWKREVDDNDKREKDNKWSLLLLPERMERERERESRKNDQEGVLARRDRDNKSI